MRHVLRLEAERGEGEDEELLPGFADDLEAACADADLRGDRVDQEAGISGLGDGEDSADRLPGLGRPLGADRREREGEIDADRLAAGRIRMAVKRGAVEHGEFGAREEEGGEIGTHRRFVHEFVERALVDRVVRRRDREIDRLAGAATRLAIPALPLRERRDHGGRHVLDVPQDERGFRHRIVGHERDETERDRLEALDHGGASPVGGGEALDLHAQEERTQLGRRVALREKRETGVIGSFVGPHAMLDEWGAVIVASSLPKG